MFKVLLFLLFPAVWAMEEEVEGYPDEIPKKSFFCQRFEQKNFMPESNFVEKSVGYIKSMFFKAGYVEFPMKNKYKLKTEDTAFFYCFVSLDKKNKHSFFVDFIFDCYRNTEDLVSSVKVNIPSKTASWLYPIVVKGWAGLSEESKEMSWKNISHILRSRFIPWVSGGETSIILKNDAVEKLYSDIKEHGLENCISRFLITKKLTNKYYDFYVLFDSAEEKKMGTIFFPNEKINTCSLV